MEIFGLIALIAALSVGYGFWSRYERRLEKEPASVDNPYGKGHDDAAHDRTN